MHEAVETAARDPEAKNFKAALDVIVRYDTEAPEHDPLAGLTREQLNERIMNFLRVAAKRRKEALASPLQ